MSKVSSQPIRVFLIRNYHKNQDSAAYNRDESIEKMLEKTFDLVIINPFLNRRNSDQQHAGILLNRVRLINSVFKKLLLSKNKGYNVVAFLRSADVILTLVVWVFCKIRGFKLAKEKNEYPGFVIKKEKKVNALIKEYIILPSLYKLYDVFFVMTDELKKYYGNYLKKQCIIQLLPMSVDFDRFLVKQNNINSGDYLFYAGSLSEKKDGVNSLITSFAITAKKFPDLRLFIAGKAETTNENISLLDLIERHGLTNQVSLLGFVSRQEIPKYLCSAKIVVLPRPDSVQARGGFPTKLGEYLASGRPVITTMVGEIPKYLTDDEVFFISPCNIVNELPKAISYILNNYNVALKVAANGQQIAKILFSVDAVAQFIKQGFTNAFNQDTNSS